MAFSWREGMREAGRRLVAGICAVLALSLLLMALAVLVQALAVLLLALLGAVVLLPHPLKWYAEQGGTALGVFFESFMHSLGHGRERKDEASMSDDTGIR